MIIEQKDVRSKSKLKTSMFVTVLGWFSYMAYDDLKDKKEKSYIDNIIVSSEKYTRKVNKVQTSKHTADFMTVQLKKIESLFQETITIEDKTIDYSFTLLALLFLDYLLLVEEDLNIRANLGHFNISKVLNKIELAHPDLYKSSNMVSMKIIDFILNIKGI